MEFHTDIWTTELFQGAIFNFNYSLNIIRNLPYMNSWNKFNLYDCVLIYAYYSFLYKFVAKTKCIIKYKRNRRGNQNHCNKNRETNLEYVLSLMGLCRFKCSTKGPTKFTAEDAINVWWQTVRKQFLTPRASARITSKYACRQPLKPISITITPDKLK